MTTCQDKVEEGEEHYQQGGGEETSRELHVLKGGPTKLSLERRSNHRPRKAEPLVGWEEGRNPRPQTHLEPVLGWSLIQQLLQLLLQLQQGVQDHLLSQLSPSGGACGVFPQEFEFNVQNLTPDWRLWWPNILAGWRGQVRVEATRDLPKFKTFSNNLV